MTITAGQSPEVLCDEIIDFFRTNVDATLAALRTDRDDPRISTTKPVNYFISDQSQPYQCPAVFVIADEIDWQKEQKGANFVNAKARINVSIVCEDRNTEILTRAVYRYMNAFKTMADQTNLTSQNSKVKMTIVVNRTRFSPLYSNAQKKGETAGVFKK